DTILEQKQHYGDSKIGNGIKVNVEFGSVNPTGPVHVGHVRGLIFGDALASLLQKAGYDVTREYYINDMGVQMDKLAQSVYLRYREAMGEDISAISEGYYPGDYLKIVGQRIAKTDGDVYMSIPQEISHDYFKNVACRMMMELIKKDLGKIGVHFDVFSSEKAIFESGATDEVLQKLKEDDLVYQGILEKPKSAKVSEDWSPREMTVFKSTLFGDETDRPLKRPDGSYTYFTPDIAYQCDKHQRGFEKLIVVFGGNYANYAMRLKRAVKIVTKEEVNVECLLVQAVNFTKKGIPLKMSRRLGTFILLSDLIQQVGRDALRFFMLTRKNDSQLDFDIEKVVEQSKDSPVFHVQYAYARACSVCRHAEQIFGKDILNDLKKSDKTLLKDESELTLIRLMSLFPRLVEHAAETKEPHRIAYYLYDLASAFHALWDKGRGSVRMRFLDEQNEGLSKARLALIQGLINVLDSGLKILGVVPTKEM
ncbi:MAG: arginine--tRNA ligase, partial [Sphingobacteriia bacterium]|nr:arginine--tRNA ligase [Sphingobacteriia bacterium]